MKTKQLALVMLSFIIMMGIAGCESSEEIKDINNVPYVPCPCEEDMQLAALSFPSGNAYLFARSIDTENGGGFIRAMRERNITQWIIFDSLTNEAELYITEHAIINICKICNFPDFVNTWNIPQDGKKVYFEGITYTSCTPQGGITNVSYFDYILTTLIAE